MPHALIIAAAVTAGVGAAIAFEVNVFKPWREEHWTEGWADGFRQEWDEFTENVRENFNDITGENRRHRGDSFGSTHQEERRGRGRRDPDQQEEMELRREMDEFSLHEAQTSSVKTRLADEFDQVQGGARLRTGKNVSKGRGFLEDTLLNAPTLGYRPCPSLYDDSETLKDNNGQSSSYQTSLIHNTATPVVVDTSHQHHSSIDTIAHSRSSYGDAASGWHSPRSIAQTEEDSTVSADWQRHFSPRSTPPRTTATSEDGESEAWTQLNDSRSASPLSLSWSESELSQAGR